MTTDVPPVQYTKAGDVSIAYRVLGDGPLDLVWVPGLFSNLEIEWEDPFLFRRFASFCRIIAFDKRGMGLSDRNVGAPSLEERMDDMRAVMDAVGSERAALLGVSEGGPMSILFAATYPERTVALVLFGTFACLSDKVGHVHGNSETIDELRRIFDDGWGSGESLRVIARSLYGDASAHEFFGRLERAAGSPGTMRTFVDTIADIDVRDVLPAVSVPTLVIHARDDHCVPIANGRFLAENIAGARFVEIDGEHGAFDFDRLAEEVESFLTGKNPTIATERVLATVLYTDIVASTERAVAIGDRRWKQLLDDHDSIVRRQVESFRGRVVKTTGDGALATFDGPARAVSCGCEIRDKVRPLGLDVRVGIHTGEIEMRGEDIGGIAVNIGARVVAAADSGQVLVSRTVTDLVAGSGISFENQGEHELKGVPGTWQLFAVNA